jgi:hypothetical protein
VGRGKPKIITRPPEKFNYSLDQLECHFEKGGPIQFFAIPLAIQQKLYKNTVCFYAQRFAHKGNYHAETYRSPGTNFEPD